MSLLESLADPDYRPASGPQCGISIILPTLDKETRALLLAALANPYAPSTSIAEAMTEKGHRLTAHVVQRHRRGGCRCPRES